MRRIFAFEGEGRVVQYEGGFTDYQAACIRKGAETGEPAGQRGGRGGGAAGKDGAAGKGGGAGSPEDGTEGAASPSSAASWKNRQPKLKFSYKEQREWDTIEDEIAALESRLEELESQIAAAATDYGRLRTLMAEKEETEQALEEKMDRWVYLNELAERIAAQK